MPSRGERNNEFIPPPPAAAAAEPTPLFESSSSRGVVTKLLDIWRKREGKREGSD